MLSRIVSRYKLAATSDLWEKAQEDLRTFNQRYQEAQKLREPLDDQGRKLLDDFAFRKNGTAPSFIGNDFQKWMSSCFGLEIDDPEAFRPRGDVVMQVHDGVKPLSEFLRRLERYKDSLQAVVDAVAPERFTYQGFQVQNPSRLGDYLARQTLEGVDYVVALFKKRGLDHLLRKGVSYIYLVPELDSTPDFNTLGLYQSGNQSITLSAKLVGLGKGRFMKWVNEAFLHEFGHYVHLSYLAQEARAEWDRGWDEVKAKQEAISLAFKSVTRDERVRYYHVLGSVKWDVSKAAKKLSSVDKVKFGVWLRTPMVGDPLLTDKQFRWSKAGQSVALYMTNPELYLKQNYELSPGEDRYDEQNRTVAKRIADKLGLTYAGNYPIPSALVEELSKADPTMEKAVEDALEKLQIVSPYGKTNEKEDFAETFVAFVGMPERLTPTSKARMERALSLSGLYGKHVMRLAGVEPPHGRQDR